MCSALPNMVSYVYRWISVMYGWQILRASWPYMGIVTICWIIIVYNRCRERGNVLEPDMPDMPDMPTCIMSMLWLLNIAVSYTISRGSSSTNQDNDQRLITSTDDSQFTWLWWWLPLRLSKRQSVSSQTVLVRTTLTHVTRTIILDLWYDYWFQTIHIYLQIL